MSFKEALPGTALIATLTLSQPALAFGLGDVISAGIQVGAKVGSAAIGKAIDATKDPEEERRKKEAEKAKKEQDMLAGVQKGLDEIEARKDLTPYQREKTKLALIEGMAQAAALSAMIEDLNERQREAERAERDKMFTAGGFLGAVAGAAVNTPSAVMARSNALAKSPDFQRDTRAMAAGGLGSQSPTDKLITAINRANEARAAESRMKEGTARMQKTAEAELAPSMVKAEVEAKDKREKFATLAQTDKAPDVFFSQDIEKTIYVEYVDNPTETQKLQDMLRAKGHRLAESRAAAQVYFRIEGEYMIGDSAQHKGLSLSAGKGLALTGPLAPPEKKEPGVLASAIGGVLKGLVKPANAAAKEPPTIYRQVALIVASRHEGNDESRHSTINKTNSVQLEATELLVEANQMLYVKLGLVAPPQEDASDSAPDSVPEQAAAS